MSISDQIKIKFSEGVLTIQFNRPERANSFTHAMVEELMSAFKQANRDPQIRCVLITGSGNTFSAGHDVSEIQQAEGQSFRDHLQQTYNLLILQIRQLEKPVIAAVNGTAAGAGLGIALACDLRIAALESNFVVGFSGIGLAPDSGVALFLPVLIGLGRALHYTFTNEPITAAQALTWGMINKVVPAENLTTTSLTYARQLAQGPVHALGLAKRDYNKSMLGNLEEVLDYEAHIQDIAGRGEEHKEGVRAFLEKRAPVFIEFEDKL